MNLPLHNPRFLSSCPGSRTLPDSLIPLVPAPCHTHVPTRPLSRCLLPLPGSCLCSHPRLLPSVTSLPLPSPRSLLIPGYHTLPDACLLLGLLPGSYPLPCLCPAGSCPITDSCTLPPKFMSPPGLLFLSVPSHSQTHVPSQALASPGYAEIGYDQINRARKI